MEKKKFGSTTIKGLQKILALKCEQNVRNLYYKYGVDLEKLYDIISKPDVASHRKEYYELFADEDVADHYWHKTMDFYYPDF